MISRRHFLKCGLVSSIGGSVALNFPKMSLAASDVGAYELRASISSAPIAGSDYPPSNLWLYNQSSPGPEIRATKGDTVRVRFFNDLPEPTSIHWHGIRIVNRMDGVSNVTQPPVQPGESFDYEFKVPDAGTFWYHAHNNSWDQVARGLYGALIVDEVDPLVDRNHDLTMVIDDWRLNDEGKFDAGSLGSLMDWTHAGRLGNWLTVNGVSQPTFTLKQNETYRLRLINAANARVLQLDPTVIGAKIIGFDGFVFDQPREPGSDPILLAPAQRMDLLVKPTDFSSARMNDVGEFALLEMMQGHALSIAIFEVDKQASTTPNRVSSLQPNSIAEPDLIDALHVELIMEGGAMGRMRSMTYNGKKIRHGDYQRTKQFWTFNGVANLAKEPLFSAKRGQTIVLRTINQTGWSHGMHLHGNHFKIIRRNKLVPEFQDWRDTFLIHGNEELEIAFVADNPGKWLLHCHMLEHAAAGMNSWFEVV